MPGHQPVRSISGKGTSLVVYSILILLWGAFCFLIGDLNEPMLTIDSFAEFATFLVFYYGMFQVHNGPLPE